MPNGYLGKILWINLTDETFKEEELSEKIYRQYIGGLGLAAKLIYENMLPNITRGNFSFFTKFFNSS